MQNVVFERGTLRTKSFMARRVKSIGELTPDGLEVNGIFIGSDDSEMKVLFVCIAAPAGGKHAVGCAHQKKNKTLRKREELALLRRFPRPPT